MHPLRGRHGARRLRPRGGRAVLAGAALDRRGAPGVRRLVLRQDQSRPFLLARLRPRGHALFGQRRPGAAGSRSCDARGLLPRGDQLRLLARRQEGPHARLLLVHSSRARRPSRPAVAPRGCELAAAVRLEPPRPPPLRRGTEFARDPRGTLLEFLQSAYDAGAMLAGWDRDGLRTLLVPDASRRQRISWEVDS